MEKQLFDAKDIYFTAMNYEKDPVVEAEYSRNLDYARNWRNDYPRPISAPQFKKLYEKLEKQIDDKGSTAHFVAHLKENDKMIGFIRFEWIEWNHRVGIIKVAIGDPTQNARYAEQIVEQGLKFAFRELNLRRVQYHIAETESFIIDALENCGFVLEVRAKEMKYREGKLVDELMYGILTEDWNARNEGTNEH